MRTTRASPTQCHLPPSTPSCGATRVTERCCKWVTVTNCCCCCSSAHRMMMMRPLHSVVLTHSCTAYLPGRLYRRRSKRGASNNRFGGASPSHHAEAPRTLPKRKTPLKMKSALIKDARGTAQGRIDDDGSWMERANRLVAQFRADGFLVVRRCGPPWQWFCVHVPCSRTRG